MSRLKQFILPDLAEGLTEAEILQWLVSVGDTIELNQPFVEVETAKSAVEIPSPYVGVVTEILHEAGTTVDVGSPIITIDTEPGAPAEAAPAAPAPAAVAESNGGAKIGETTADGRTAVLVGYGAKAPTTVRRARKGAPAPAPAVPAPVAPAPVVAAPVAPVAPVASGGPALAKPPVRKLAKDLGVDLHALVGTGPNGSITREDVTGAVAPVAAPVAVAVAVAEPVAVVASEGDQRIPVKGVRKLTAENMVASAFSAPHVTEFLTVDATRLLKTVAKMKESKEFDGVRVGPLALLAKGVLLALKRHPMVNSSWDEAAQEIVVKKHVNLGIAAATPRGLIVPNIKAAETLSTRELSEALVSLTSTARDGKTPPADMTGGSFTITNVGVFGVDTGTPILPPGEAAILAFGAIREMPWVHKGKVVPRHVTTLGLSFDHRIIDGELGSKFLADLGRFVQNPQEMLLAWA
ncbi:dihydrolipoamide acetyltransferase component of pyruvate dehydrogenase complex [Actinorhabdospora filicis]|uniref:Dihydrolipoamide acetyltransferase component of pyruvate dehydrogenase complex n=1 Tax=Actinorhabdospora filicis TaxID=1785913 RepID=A0A9W6SQN8_9ACTN|nr:dihydrolipoamide acetyltransferase family protein [Actinorhabdospora filicis]GLZ80506.1 dihydrolipoamide acetyltransferase component of pyruvate dehydrogenase complex [Actinorhabdospora filicis]